MTEDKLGHTRLATLHSLILDPRLKALSPKHTKEEYEQLEKSMLENGIEVSLVIDQQTTICCDGMTRLEIAQKHPDKFQFIPIDERTFQGIDDMKRFVIENTLTRRQLTEPQKVSLALALKPILKKLAAARKKAGITIGPNEPKGKTTELLAKRAGVSNTTMLRYEKIQKTDPKLFREVMSGKKKPGRAYNELMIKENARLPRLAIPNTEVNVIVYDPGWPFGNTVSGGSGNSGASQNYRVESIEEMKNNPVWKIAAKNAILFLWALPTHHIEATEVIQASGFTPLTKLYWDKMEMKQGFNFRNSVEECIVCTKGDVKAFNMTDQANIIHEKPIERIHSRKPEKFFEIFVEAAKRGLPGQELKMIEINATKKREGWITVGNQIESFSDFCKREYDLKPEWIDCKYCKHLHLKKPANWKSCTCRHCHKKEVKFNERTDENQKDYKCQKCRKGKHSECSQYNIPNSACNCKHKKEITLACKDCFEIFHSKEALKEHKPNCPKAKFIKHVNAETGQVMFACNKLCVHQVKK